MKMNETTAVIASTMNDKMEKLFSEALKEQKMKVLNEFDFKKVSEMFKAFGQQYVNMNGKYYPSEKELYSQAFNLLDQAIKSFLSNGKPVRLVIGRLTAFVYVWNTSVELELAYVPHFSSGYVY